MGDRQSAAAAQVRRVAWSDQAREDLIGIGLDIEASNPRAASEVASGLVDLSESLREFPNRGRPVRPGVRELTSFRPYVIRYAVLDAEVRIIAIRHAARRPMR